jgi:cytochrome c oxidase assembly protein subunit 15
MTSSLRSDRSSAVAIWLWATALVVFALLVVGGVTRLTDSGLSITQWRPISGTLPPLSAAAWAHEFSLYQRIPQYRLVNPDMTVESFKFIYWWEWSHRLLARTVGLIFALPLMVFLIGRQIPRRLILPCLGRTERDQQGSGAQVITVRRITRAARAHLPRRHRACAGGHG